MVRHSLLLGAGWLLASCGQSGGDPAANQAARAEQPKKKAGYCFFKDAETKGWSASRDKDGNIVVKGKAYRSDPRYKALLNPATVSGTTVEVTPTISQNGGYAAPDNWWDVSEIIPNSGAVDTVQVTCGPKTLADLKVASKG